MNKYEEALNRIAFNFGLDCLDENITEEEQDNLAKDITLMNELVEKEIPKKPNIDYVIDDTYCFCPVCGNIIIEKRMLNTVSSDLFKKSNSFCSQCGQAIDWRDEE